RSVAATSAGSASTASVRGVARRGSGTAGLLSVAEADGNRTRLAELLDHNGFEDRARHPTRYASASSLVSAADPRRLRAGREGRHRRHAAPGGARTRLPV